MKKSSMPKTELEEKQSKEIPKFIGGTVEHKISFSFSLGEKDYYEFDEDIYFLPFRRGIVASMFYKELQCGVDREYLIWHTKEMDAIFKNTSQFDIGRMAILNQHLKDRIEYIFEPDLIYKLASVVYFDKEENPYNYSLQHGYEKIEYWKKNEKVEDFFLRQPIKRLVPFFKQDEKNILDYLMVAEKIKQQHSINLGSQSSKKDTTIQNQ